MDTFGDRIWYEYVNWFQLVQDVVQWQTLLGEVMTTKNSQGSDVVADMFRAGDETYSLMLL